MKDKKLFRLLMISVWSFMAIGCSNNDGVPRRSQAVDAAATADIEAPRQLKGKIVDGTDFEIDTLARYENETGDYAAEQWQKYSAKVGKPECNGSICLSIDGYQYLCEKASGVTKGAINGITITASVTKYLIDNGTFEGSNVKWETFMKSDGNRAGRCIVSVSASGIYDGSSVRKTTEAQVTQFSVVGNEILVSMAYPTYTNFNLKD